MSKAVDIIDGVLFVYTRHYDDVNRVIICHQKKPYRVFSDDEKKEDSRPHGEWIKGKEISRTMLIGETLYIDYENFTCSVCGLVLDRLLYNVDGSPFYKFCPNCGASMLEGGEGDERRN